MTMPLLATKLYIPVPRRKIVLRPRLLERMNAGLAGKLTLVSAPAGFGKTTLVSEWTVDCGRPAAWLSLDEADNDTARFLRYLISALQKIEPTIGQGVLGLLESPQAPPIEQMLTALVNEINALHADSVLVFDDYHVIDSKPVDDALAFLLEYLPPQIHLVITTREDPNLPLARLRVSNQMTELRAADLSFNISEAADFLNQVMELNLTADEIDALETRTEGWIAGLQLAAISMRGQKKPADFIKSFTGSHHFVLDYLVEEVIKQQPDEIQAFLLRTSILDRMCGALCDAVIENPSVSGQEILESLEQANLFIIPLDDERRWYRYHHLFADLLRQRLLQSSPSQILFRKPDEETDIAAHLHVCASRWYEENGLEVEAFQHAAAANDIDRAERLIEGKGMPLHFRGAITPILHWLESLPSSVLDSRPSLWVTFGSATMISGHPSNAEPKLLAAEAGLKNCVENTKTRDLIGQIASIRSLVAATQNDAETIINQANRALEYLSPENTAVRSMASFSLGIANELRNDREAARRAYSEVMTASQASGNFMFTLASMSSLAGLQIAENQLPQAFETYLQIQKFINDPKQWVMYESYYYLACIYYEWNDLESAEKYIEACLQLAPQIECGTSISGTVLLARLYMIRGDITGAEAILTRAMEMTDKPTYCQYLSEIIEGQVAFLIHQGNLDKAADLAKEHHIPVSLARVYLARGDSASALAILEPLHHEIEMMNRPDRQLKMTTLLAAALFKQGDREKALAMLRNAMILGEPGGFIRTFVDEGDAMRQLLVEAHRHGIMPKYTSRLLAAFAGGKPSQKHTAPQSLIEPLSQRELEVLQLMAKGLSNREISERLFLALSTVKGHSRIIFDKLQVQRRTEAVARARELGLL